MPRSGGFRAYAADPVCSVGEASRLHAAIFPNHGRELSKIVQPGLRMLFEVGRVRRGLQEILRTPRRVPATIARQLHASSSNIKRSPYFLSRCFCSLSLHASSNPSSEISIACTATSNSSAADESVGLWSTASSREASCVLSAIVG